MKAKYIFRTLLIISLLNLTIIFNLSATVFTVDNAANTDDFAAASAGTMTFVKCIRLASADATGGAMGHRIYFNIGAAGQKILSVTSIWQILSNTNLNNLIIDGSTQPFAGIGPHVIFVAGGVTEGIAITSGVTNVTLNGLGFRDFQISIKMDNALSCKITNCFLGTDNTGTTPQCTGCTGDGIRMLNGSQFNIVGGGTAGTKNIIFKHLNGVYLTGGTTSDNTIGATAAGEANVISANTQDGVYVFNAGTNNKIAGNIIGLDISGTVASATYSNLYKGIHIQGSQSAIIGGATAGERNIVSGNGYGTGNDGIFLETGCHSSTITNCYIGLDITGIVPLANKIRGILILASNNCQVYSNFITAHSEIGIYLQNSAG
ncbi:MAG TPA: hypothetical protein VNW99_10110, partial [Cytophagaceae bacterium]|nr:hypothetical protein [Cytophagaceae bacterium]